MLSLPPPVSGVFDFGQGDPIANTPSPTPSEKMLVNKFIGPTAVLVAFISMSGSALAGYSVAKGVVQSLDAKACTVTLADKTVYSFGTHCNLSRVKLGEKVTISWSMHGTVMTASQLVATP